MCSRAKHFPSLSLRLPALEMRNLEDSWCLALLRCLFHARWESLRQDTGLPACWGLSGLGEACGCELQLWETAESSAWAFGIRKRLALAFDYQLCSLTQPP